MRGGIITETKYESLVAQRAVKKNSNKYKKELKIKRWSRDGRAKKYTNKICRDNQIHYTSLRLLIFLNNIIIHAPNYVSHV